MEDGEWRKGQSCWGKEVGYEQLTTFPLNGAKLSSKGFKESCVVCYGLDVHTRVHMLELCPCATMSVRQALLQ
jgi:hypothetical protein